MFSSYSSRLCLPSSTYESDSEDCTESIGAHVFLVANTSIPFLNSIFVGTAVASIGLAIFDKIPVDSCLVDETKTLWVPVNGTDLPSIADAAWKLVNDFVTKNEALMRQALSDPTAAQQIVPALVAEAKAISGLTAGVSVHWDFNGICDLIKYINGQVSVPILGPLCDLLCLFMELLVGGLWVHRTHAPLALVVC